jgi:hypothetical protein
MTEIADAARGVVQLAGVGFGKGDQLRHVLDRNRGVSNQIRWEMIDPRHRDEIAQRHVL